VSDLAAVLAIARKDLLQELRSKAATVATVFFTATTLLMMAFALGREQGVLERSAPGVLWVALVFAGVTAAAQSFQADLEDGALDQLLTYPVPRAAVYLGKMLATWAYLSVLGLLLAPIATTLYGAAVTGTAAVALLALTVVLGAFGFATIATLYAALTANLQAREALLPVLMFPVVVPIVLAAVRATESLLGGAGGPVGDWLLLLLGFDLVYFVVCASLFHFVVDE